MSPAWLRIAGGNPHLPIVEGLFFFSPSLKGREGFDKLSPNGSQNITDADFRIGMEEGFKVLAASRPTAV